jgi:hypothetical protein
MKLATALLPLALLSFVFAGCAAQTDDGASNDADEIEVDSTEEAVTGAPSNFGYFQVTRRDFRKCAAPLCGGFFVKRVNEATTLCADGKKQAECYVSAIQLSGTGLSAREQDTFRAALESGKGLVKARTYKTKWGGQFVGLLKANEAWLGATGSSIVDGGTFYRAADNGIRCITAPCPSTTAYQLNSNQSHNVIDVKLENTQIPADQATLNRAQNALGTKEGILLVGGVALPKCLPNTNCGPFVSATEFYLRMTRREGEGCGFWIGYDCNPGQFCNWAPEDICGAADASGKCSYKPEACIQLYDPVCACDGNTYGNACMAAAAGYSVSSKGECSPAPGTK